MALTDIVFPDGDFILTLPFEAGTPEHILFTTPLTETFGAEASGLPSHIMNDVEVMNLPIWPDPSDVKSGVVYGDSNEHTGTLAGSAGKINRGRLIGGI